MSSDSNLLVEQDGATLRVTLNRAAKLNALDGRIRDELEDLWRVTAGDRSVRCVILTGAGRGFCAGADIATLSTPRVSRGDLDGELAFLPGRNLDVPVVVAVNGICAGGGLHFVADADIVIAAQSAGFVDPHVSVGQVTGIEPASLLPLISAQQVARLAYLGQNGRINVAAALAAGLVAEVVPDDALIARAQSIAASICAGSPDAIRASRRVLRTAIDAATRASMEAGWAAVQRHWSHPDAVEGPVAHAERRAPRWQIGEPPEQR